MFDVISYSLNKKYTDESIQGISGTLAGKNCVISDISKVGGTTTVTFQWTADDGTTRTQSMQVKDGETPQMTVIPITGGNRITFATSTDSITFDVEDGVSPTCTVTDITGGHRVKFTTKNGSETFDVMDGVDGVSVDTVTVDSSNHLVLTFDDGTEHDAGEITTLKGDDGKSAYEVAVEQGYVGTVDEWLASLVGFSPTITVEESTDTIYKLRITNQDGSYVTPNLKGSGGGGGSIAELSDVSLNNLQNAQVLKYDATNQVWVNANSGAVIDELGDIADVDLVNLVNGDVLTWDNINSKWVNNGLDSQPVQYSEKMLNSGAIYASEHAITQKIGDLTQLETTDKTNLVGAVNEVKDSYGNQIGDLTQLTTDTKTSLVGAINEVDANADAVDTKVGNLNSLTTTDKTSVVLAINELDGGLKALRYVEQLTTMGNASDKPNKIVQYVGTTNVDYTKGYFYYSEPSVVSGEVVYNWIRTDIQPTNTDYENLSNLPQINDVELVGNKSLDDLEIQKTIQYATMPSPSVDWSSGIIVQYLGATTQDLKNGYFYRCQYIVSDDEYKWVQVDVSGNTELANRVTTLEANQGDMSTISISGVNDLVGAINVLAVRGIQSITYVEPYLTILLQNGDSYQFDLRVVLSSTDIGDLGNVIDTTIQNGELLAYDTSILKYKPYNVVNALSATLQSSKDYTDQQIASAVQEDAFIVDKKPNCTLDSSTGQYIVVYYQNSVLKTTTAISSRFYYKDTNQDPYCTSWFVTGDPNVDPVEFTYLISTPDFDDYVNKNTDIVNTYSPDMVDKTKVPNIASLDALYLLVSTALSAKTNVADIVDSLLSDDATVPLSAKQGKVIKGLIDEKQSIIQMSIMPQVTPQMVTDKIIYQYIGDTSLAYTQGYFYLASYNSTDDVYYWKLIEFAPDMVEITAQEVDNLWV